MKALPLWIAVPITVLVSLPFGLWLGAWSLPLWLAFIVWAEYFTLGARPAALKIMIPAFVSGAWAQPVLAFDLVESVGQDAPCARC